MEIELKVDLIGMILNNTRSRCFGNIIVDDDGKIMDAMHALDYMIMEYARVRNGGTSTTVVVPKCFKHS